MNKYISYQIDDKTKYIQFNNDIDFYEYLGDFPIINHYGLAIEIIKDNYNEILSYQRIDYENKSLLEIKKLLINDIKKHQILFPDYNNSSLNIISSIRNNFGYSSKYPIIPNLFNKKYKHVALLLLDGMGINVLNDNLSINGLFNKNLFTKLNCVFPSTTAASTTSIISGLTPLESGWTGWENYIKEFNRNIVLFSGENYYTKEKTGISGYDLMPYSPFFNDMNISSRLILPDYNKDNNSLKDLLKRSLEGFNNNDSLQYIYFTEPDTTMHINGEDSNLTKEVLNKIEKDVSWYYNNLKEDTILIITADHGHINTNMLNMYKNKRLFNLLERNPSNDSRCLTFKVKNNKDKEFIELFNHFYSEIYDLYSKDEAINFFGDINEDINPRINDFLADYIAVAKSNYYFNYSNSNHIFKSHHAGYTKEEMEVPVIVLRK